MTIVPNYMRAELPEVTPTHLTPAQQTLLVAISGGRCAWRVRNGWQPKGSLRHVPLKVGDAILARGLADVLGGKGSGRLVLTDAGEILARDIKQRKNRRRT